MPQLLPLFDDAKEAVRLRAAAGYLRLAWLVKPPPPTPAKPAIGTQKAAAPAVSAKKQ
jgi:hypothetical protein